MAIELATVGELLESVAARRPTPGGGAVSGVVAGLAAALGEMVLRYRMARPSQEGAVDAAHQKALETLSGLRAEAPRLADADVEAFGKLSVLLKLPPGDERRRRELAGAVEAAIAAPRRVMEASLEALQALHDVRHSAGKGLRSDLAIAALLAQAAAEAAAWNVRVNLAQVQERSQAARLEAQAAAALRRAEALRGAIEQACLGPDQAPRSA